MILSLVVRLVLHSEPRPLSVPYSAHCLKRKLRINTSVAVTVAMLVISSLGIYIFKAYVNAVFILILLAALPTSLWLAILKNL